MSREKPRSSYHVPPRVVSHTFYFSGVAMETMLSMKNGFFHGRGKVEIHNDNFKGHQFIER